MLVIWPPSAALPSMASCMVGCSGKWYRRCSAIDAGASTMVTFNSRLAQVATGQHPASHARRPSQPRCLLPRSSSVGYSLGRMGIEAQDLLGLLIATEGGAAGLVVAASRRDIRETTDVATLVAGLPSARAVASSRRGYVSWPTRGGGGRPTPRQRGIETWQECTGSAGRLRERA